MSANGNKAQPHHSEQWIDAGCDEPNLHRVTVPHPQRSEQQEWTIPRLKSYVTGLGKHSWSELANLARTIQSEFTTERQRFERLIEATHEVYKKQLARLEADYTLDLNAKLEQINKQAKTIRDERELREQADVARQEAQQNCEMAHILAEDRKKELLSALAAIDDAIKRTSVRPLLRIDPSLLHEHDAELKAEAELIGWHKGFDDCSKANEENKERLIAEVRKPLVDALTEAFMSELAKVKESK